MKEPRVADLTISELKDLIRSTVQEAVAEVMIEFAAVAEAEAKLTEDAEIADYLRSSIQGKAFVELKTMDWDD